MRAALVIALLSIAVSAAADPYADCRLERVIDGDTLDCVCNGRLDRVRLLRIDTPERGDPGFSEAREALAGLIGSSPLRLEFEPPREPPGERVGEPTRDRYGRLLAYVWVDGRNVNVDMVAAGWSDFWTRFGEGRHAADFRRAAAGAPDRGLGLAGRRGAPAAPPAAQSSEPFGAETGERSCRQRESCCRVCSRGRACGASCISASKTCRKGAGCACQESEICH